MIDALDLSASRFRADPYPHYRRLRDNDPVHWSDAAGSWVLTRYDDVRAALTDGRFAHWTETLENAPSPFLRSLARWLWLLHPGSNSRLRDLVRPLFTTATAEAMRPEIAAHVSELAPDAVDLMTQIAEPLTMFVAVRLLGVPDAGRFAEVAQPLMRDFEALWIAQLQQKPLPASAAGLAEYIASAGREENFIAALDRARREGDAISADDILTFVILFLFAAQENIKSFIGNAVLGLAQDDDAWRSLRDKPSLMPAAVDELLRFDSPVQFVALRAREEVTMGGRVIAAGDAVLAGIAAANRDPETFADPDRLDFARRGAHHLSFGAGAFYCIGAAYARVEAEETIATLVRMFDVPSVNLAEVEWKSFPVVLRGPRSARIAFQQFPVSEKVGR